MGGLIKSRVYPIEYGKLNIFTITDNLFTYAQWNKDDGTHEIVIIIRLDRAALFDYTS